MGVILDEDEEIENSDIELEDHPNENDPLLLDHTSTNGHSFEGLADAQEQQKSTANGQISLHKLQPPSYQYIGRDTKHPSQFGKQDTLTKEVVEMQFLTPRRNFRKRSELHPAADEYYEIGEASRERVHAQDRWVFAIRCLRKLECLWTTLERMALSVI